MDLTKKSRERFTMSSLAELWIGDVAPGFGDIDNGVDSSQAVDGRKSLSDLGWLKNCGTGGGGFKSGNTCARGGGAGVITDPKVASKLIAVEAVKSSQVMLEQGRILPQDVPSVEEIEKNWLKVFRSRKDNEGDKPAFSGLNPELKTVLDSAMKENKSNKPFQEFVAANGDSPVIYRRAEKGRSAAAEYRAGIHIYDSPFWKGEGTEPMEPGKATAGGMGGYGAVIRHEYGHKLYGSLPAERRREWSTMVPTGDEVKSGLTSYAGKNHEETFCELFAVATDPKFDASKFPAWVSELHAKQKEWFL